MDDDPEIRIDCSGTLTRSDANPNRRAHAEACIYSIGGSSNSLGELGGLDSQCRHIDRGRNSECGEKLLADQGNRVPWIRPLVRTGLCQSLRPIPVLVPSLSLGLQVCV